MKNKLICKFIKTLFFLFIVIIIFVMSSRILERKTYYGPWNYSAKLKEFYSLKEDSIDYVGIGSSHMYCTLNPLEVWKNSGIPGFVLATQQQPLTASYYYLKEVFKTQKPKVVFIEGYMAIDKEKYPTESVARDAIEPLKFSINKLELINAIVPKKDRNSYYFNIIKYHNRWKELTKKDIENSIFFNADTYKGYVCIEGKEKHKLEYINYNNVEKGQVSYQNIEALDNIYNLVNKNNAKMVLLIAPYEVKFAPFIKTEIDWAKQKGIDIIDITQLYNVLNINPDTDFYDKQHFDVDGARKASFYISEYLKKLNININKNIDSKKWEADFNIYKEIKK